MGELESAHSEIALVKNCLFTHLFDNFNDVLEFTNMENILHVMSLVINMGQKHFHWECLGQKIYWILDLLKIKIMLSKHLFENGDMGDK